MTPYPNEPAGFSDESLRMTALSGGDVRTRLRHFAIITYAVSPDRVRPYVDPNFDLDCIVGTDGAHKVCVSVVPFEDYDFHFHAFPWLRFRFGQTNYRTYVIERATGRRAVWFFGTTLGSWTVGVPRHLWKLPWHGGNVEFQCTYDNATQRYLRYQMATRSPWAPLELELEDSGASVNQLDGFSNLDSGLMVLTHPLVGFYYRQDKKLGSYHIWHDRLQCNRGQLVHARISLLDRLGLVSYTDQLAPHSVLIQHQTDFVIYLPPRILRTV